MFLRNILNTRSKSLYKERTKRNDIMTNLLEINDLAVSFHLNDREVRAVRGVNLTVKKGETLAIVGESGSGKSVTAQSIMRLVPMPPGKFVSGNIMFNGEDIIKKSEKEMQDIRGKDISMVFQEPMTSLNPVFTIGSQVQEVLFNHTNITKKEARLKSIDLMRDVGINRPEKVIDEYPHQLSGGMRQRVMIAMAIALHPKLLIADEPTTALDATVQAQILDLLKEIQQQKNMSTIIITHDLGVVASAADRVAVMYAGKVVEVGTVDEIFYNPQHPYTWGLLGSMPTLESNEEALFSIPGNPPDMANLPKGDAFAPRNPYVLEIDREKEPPMFKVSDTHYAATWLLHEDAPNVEPPEEIKRRRSHFQSSYSGSPREDGAKQ